MRNNETQHESQYKMQVLESAVLELTGKGHCSFITK